VAMELGAMETISWRQLKTLAARLSGRALQLANMDLREISGFDVLVNLVEREANPDEFVSEITQMNMNLGHKLKSNVISLELVEWLEDDVLTLFLSQFSRDDLVALLIGRLESCKDLIVAKMSPQIVEYINFNLDPEFRKKISTKKVRAAEQKAYKVLKDLFKEGQISFEDINQKKTVWLIMESIFFFRSTNEYLGFFLK